MNAAAPAHAAFSPPMRSVEFCIRICGATAWINTVLNASSEQKRPSSFSHFRILNNGHQFTTAERGNSAFFFSFGLKKVRYFTHAPPVQTNSHFSRTLERLAHIQFKPLPSFVTLRQTLMLLFLCEQAATL